MNSFEDAWQLFASTVLTELPPRSLEIARQVYYTGGATCLGYLELKMETLPIEEVDAAFDALRNEFLAFKAQVTGDSH